MKGVVIWYSKQDLRAVIWCEDSQELGMALGPAAWRHPVTPVEIGDFVAFHVDGSGHDRRCHDIHVLERKAAPTLIGAIRDLGRRAKGISGNPPLHLCASRD